MDRRHFRREQEIREKDEEDVALLTAQREEAQGQARKRMMTSKLLKNKPPCQYSQSSSQDRDLEAYLTEQQRFERLSLPEKIKVMQQKMPEKTCLQKCVKALNYLSCFAMFLVATERFRTYDPTLIYMDGFYCIFTCYLFVFSMFLFSAEYEFLVILKYFACLASDWGKGLFQIFVGVLLFDNRRPIELGASLYLVVGGLLNLMMACCHKGNHPSTDLGPLSEGTLTAEQRKSLRAAKSAALQITKLSTQERQQLTQFIAGAQKETPQKQEKQSAPPVQNGAMLEGGCLQPAFNQDTYQVPANYQSIYGRDLGVSAAQRATMNHSMASFSDLDSDFNDYTGGKYRPRQTLSKNPGSHQALCADNHSSAGSLFDYYEERVKRMKQTKNNQERSDDYRLMYERGHSSASGTPHGHQQTTSTPYMNRAAGKSTPSGALQLQAIMKEGAYGNKHRVPKEYRKKQDTLIITL